MDMKKYLFVILSLFTLIVHAQKTAPKPNVTSKQPPALKNLTDSVSYAIGMMVAGFYRQQGIKKLNSSLVSKAVNDVFDNKKCLLTDNEANLSLMSYLNPELSKNIKEGETFLATNKKRPEVKTTPSGLQYEVLVEGKGVKPGPVDSVTVNYAGTLLNGKPFDSNNGISFALNKVIAGWTEGLQLMAVGSKHKLYVPYQLGYGMNDNGPIPGGSLLVFEVELVNIKKK